MAESLGGYFGLILGAAVAGLRRSGTSAAEVHRMVEVAFQSLDLTADAAIREATEHDSA